MEQDLIPDPVSSYKPKQTFGTINTAATGIDPSTLSTLQDMSKEALISLIQRVSGAMWGIGLMTNEERREAKKLRISIIALTSKDSLTVLRASNDWLDREEGKAVQRIDQRVLNVHKGVVADMTTNELLEALRGIKQLPDGVKILENGLLDVTDVVD